MRRVVFQPAARRDLIDIYAYIAERDEAAAVRFTDRLRASAESLAEFPYRFPAVPEYGPGVHKLSVAGHAIFYRVTRESVLVSCVLHGRRDWNAILI